jgi:magnesium chelatase family protein
MEDRRVTISRARMSVDFPSSFILLASMNPCPCGYYNHPDRECTCPPGAVSKYLNKISGPLLDRIDLHVEVVPVPYQELGQQRCGESSLQIRERVMAARAIQQIRYEKSAIRTQGDRKPASIFCNAQISSRLIHNFCRIDAAGERLLYEAMRKLKLSARAHDHILKVSRTIADLAGSEPIRNDHLSEAIQFRSLDREGWAG